MTLLQRAFAYDRPIGEREVRALDEMREIYGIRLLSWDEKAPYIFVEYDASRITESDIAFMLRNAGIRLQHHAGKAA